MQQYSGKIRKIHLDERVFEILIKDKVEFFYLSRSQMKKFNMYLQVGLFVYFTCKEEAQVHGKFKAYEVINFTKMIYIKGHRRTVYFDIDTIKMGVASVLNRNTNKMFLDMEFTMPSYDFNNEKPFVAEIIQYGILIENADGQVILSDSSLVKPKNQSGLNARTFNFLNIEKEDFKKAITPKAFYKKLKKYMEEYNPVIYVWGKNDIITLDAFYVMHKLEPVTSRKNFVNLMQLMKNYLGQKSDIGLFNALTYLDPTFSDSQDHNALEDASVTSMIYHLFRKRVNEEIENIRK